MSRHAFFNYTIGLIGMTISWFFLWRQWPDKVVIAAAVFLSVILLTDTLSSRIPNFAVVLMVLAGLTINGVTDGVSGLGFSILGLSAGM